MIIIAYNNCNHTFVWIFHNDENKVPRTNMENTFRTKKYCLKKPK